MEAGSSGEGTNGAGRIEELGDDDDLEEEEVTRVDPGAGKAQRIRRSAPDP